MIEPSCATWLTGSPPARLLSMKVGLSKVSFGGFGLGQFADELAAPESGSSAASNTGTSRNLSFIRDPP
jgi:hypothetical protein